MLSFMQERRGYQKIHICLFVRKKYKNDKPETKEIGYLQGVSGERSEMGLACVCNRGAGMKRGDTSLNISILKF